jgi:hypothetical protein
MSDSYTGKPEKPRPFPKGKYQVVSADQVAALTAAGGAIIQVLETQQLVAQLEYYPPLCARCRDRLDVQLNTAGGYSGRCFRCNTSSPLKMASPFTIDTHSFLVMIEVDQVYADLERRCERAGAELHEQYKKNSALAVELKQLKEKLGAAIEQQKAAESRANNLERDLATARTDLSGQVPASSAAPRGSFG